MCSCPYVSADAQGGQKEEMGALEFKLHTVVSCPTWVLRTNLQSSGRATSTCDCWAIFPDAGHFLLKNREKGRELEQGGGRLGMS